MYNSDNHRHNLLFVEQNLGVPSPTSPTISYFPSLRYLLPLLLLSPFSSLHSVSLLFSPPHFLPSLPSSHVFILSHLWRLSRAGHCSTVGPETHAPFLTLSEVAWVFAGSGFSFEFCGYLTSPVWTLRIRITHGMSKAGAVYCLLACEIVNILVWCETWYIFFPIIDL